MEIKLKEELRGLKPGESLIVEFNEDKPEKQIKEAEAETLKAALAELEPGESLIVRF